MAAHILKGFQDELEKEFFDMYIDATDKQQAEWDAALKIQRVWRGHAVRSSVIDMILGAWCAQRWYRGHLGRVRFGNYQRDISRKLRKQFFDTAATVIQRYWHGYMSRKYKHSMIARRRFIRASTIASERFAEDATFNVEYQTIQLEQKEREDRDVLFEKTIAGKHHLASTEVRPGVYNSPFAKVCGGTPEMNGVPVDEHLKNSFKILGTLDVTSSNECAQYAVDPRTLQASSQYELPEAARRNDALVHKLETFHERPFLSTIKGTPLNHRHFSHNVHTPYNAELMKSKEALKKSQQARMEVHDRAFYNNVNKQSLFEDYVLPSQKLANGAY